LIGRQYFVSKASVALLAARPIQIEETQARRLRTLEERVASHMSTLDRLSTQLDTLHGQLEQQGEEMGRRIDEMSIHLQALMDKMGGTLGDLLSEMDSLHVQKDDELGRQISELAERVSKMETPRAARHAQRSRAAERQTPTETAIPPQVEDFVLVVERQEDLPQDALPLTQFAKALGIHRSSLYEFLIKHRMPHYGIIKRVLGGRKPELDRYVTAEQQAAIRSERER
jgi:TolA-binding protein